MKDGMSEGEARAQAAAMPESEEIEAKPKTNLQEALELLTVEQQTHGETQRRAVALAEEVKALRVRLGEPAPDERAKRHATTPRPTCCA
jgi:hypothetical protein